MVHGIHIQNERKPNRPKRISCHLKIVGRVIWMGAPLKPPSNGGDKKRDGGWRQYCPPNKIIIPINIAPPQSPLRENANSCRNAFHNDKRTQPSAPNNNTTTTTTTTTTWLQQWHQQCGNSNSNNNKSKGAVPPPTPPTATDNTAKKPFPMGR